MQVFPWVWTKSSVQGELVSFARTVLARHRDRPVGRWVIRARGSGSSTSYSLEERR